MVIGEEEATLRVLAMLDTPEIRAALSTMHAPGESRSVFEEQVKDLAAEIGERAD